MPEEDTTENAGGGVETDVGQGTKKDEGKQRKGVGGKGDDAETQLTILTGKEMEWFFDKNSGKWYVEYGLPKSDRSVLFEASPDQMDALFGENRRPTEFSKRTLKQLTGNQKRTFSGNIAEMEGKGRFEDEVERVTTLALDSGVLPSWADPTEVMDILYISQAESKSMEWTIDQIAKTDGFKTRFNGINKFKSNANMTMIEAVQGYLEFEAGVKAAVNASGMNMAKVTPEVVGGLLGKGYALETVAASVAKFDRMRKYAPAMEAFNSILAQQGLEPIKTLQDQFDFLSGTAGAEVYEMWEASSMAEAAEAAGLGDVYSAEDAMRFAAATEGQTSLGDATNMFSEAANLLLRLRHEVDMGKFGIEQEDIIDMSLGQPPRSGTSATDLSENINRAVLSAQKTLQAQSQPFVGFEEQGTPKRQSLGGLRTT